MADVRVTPERIVPAGLEATYDATLLTTDTYFVRGSATILHFKKTGVGECVVTFVTDKTVGGLALENPTVSVPATTGDVFVRLNPAYENADRDIKFTLSEITGLSLAALSV